MPWPHTLPEPRVALASAALRHVTDAALDKAIGHGFRNDQEVVLAMVLALDPLASRYELPGWRGRFPVLGQWNEQVRYEASDRVGAAFARQMVKASTALVTEVVAALWADGRLPPVDDLIRVKP